MPQFFLLVFFLENLVAYLNICDTFNIASHVQFKPEASTPHQRA